MERQSNIFTVAELRRQKRVTAILFVVIFIGFADMILTIHLMSTTGMLEMNPLARWLAKTDLSNLTMFKCFTVLFNAGLLWALRRRFSAELGAWITLLVLIGLAVQWTMYLSVWNIENHEELRETLVHDTRWIVASP